LFFSYTRSQRLVSPLCAESEVQHKYCFCLYLADSSHPAVDPLVPLAGLHRLLLEEEIDFIVVWTVSVGDGEGAHKVRF